MATLNDRLKRLEDASSAGTIALDQMEAGAISEHLIRMADRAQAIGGPGGLNVARQLLMDVAKLNGLVTETHETVSRTPEERKARLDELRAERERLIRRRVQRPEEDQS